MTVCPLAGDRSHITLSPPRRTLLIAAADMRRNVQFFQYEPPLASEDVTLAADLKRRADFNVGSIICKMVRPSVLLSYGLSLMRAGVQVAAKMNHTTAAVSGVAPLNRFALLFGKDREVSPLSLPRVW